MDIFAVGICMFILAFKCPAWEAAQIGNPYFAHVHRAKENGLESLLKMWGKTCLCPGAMTILTDMLQIHPSRRPSAAACLEYPWFSSMAAASETPAPLQKETQT
jgi:serine/threonine protein kinase